MPPLRPSISPEEVRKTRKVLGIEVWNKELRASPEDCRSHDRRHDRRWCGVCGRGPFYNACYLEKHMASKKKCLRLQENLKEIQRMPSPDNLQNIQEVPPHCVEIKTIESRFTRLVARYSNQLGDNTSGWLNAMRAASGRGEKFDVLEKLEYMMEKLAEQGFLNRIQPCKRLASKCIKNKPLEKKEQWDCSTWPQTLDPQQQPPPPMVSRTSES